MTIFYGDFASFQKGVRLDGTVAACIKATQGTWYANPEYRATVQEANRNRAFVFAYHFLEHGNGRGQAEWYVRTRNHMRRPVMVDVEKVPGKANPTIQDLVDFVEGVRHFGGLCHLVYLPKWYWRDNLASPDLTWFRKYQLRLVSSEYTTYHDNGPGWQPYGGMYPQIWQYSNNFNMHGIHCDFNAFKGTVSDLQLMAQNGELRGS